MKVLPNVGNVEISIEKFVDYALDPVKGKGKAYAFERALGYGLSNADKLIENIRQNLKNFEAREKGDNGYGFKYEVTMNLTGENGKVADVLTAWIVEHGSGETRLTSAYVINRRKQND
ncbi:MAG: hypothetical protein FWF77_07090 [Defluviitaleaceae bacterium]|nr:hypothetical protein [Defluviitaleaceae bacterium]